MADKILGLDPATKASGWAVLQGDRVLGSGVYRAPGTVTGKRVEQLAAIHAWARSLCRAWQPALVVVESVHHGPNAQTTLRLAEVGAVILLAANYAACPVTNVSPVERLQALGLDVRASKEEVVTAVNRLFGLEITDHNEADAVAIAVAGAGIRKVERLRWREV